MQSTVSLYGVLIADVVASRSTPDLRSSLNDKLRIASIAQLDEQLIRVPYAVTAGDEFQVVAARLERIPKLSPGSTLRVVGSKVPRRGARQLH